MLIDFIFKNIRSFKDEVTFSMEVGEGITEYVESNTVRLEDIEVVKSLVVMHLENPMRLEHSDYLEI